MDSFESALKEAGEQWAVTGEAIARVLGAMVVQLDDGGDRAGTVGAVEHQRIDALEKTVQRIANDYLPAGGATASEFDERLTALERLCKETVLPACESVAAQMEVVQAVVDDSVVARLQTLSVRLDYVVERLDGPDGRGWK